MIQNGFFCDHDWSRTSTSEGHYPLKVARLPIPPRGQYDVAKSGRKVTIKKIVCATFYRFFSHHLFNFF